jgi:hypothetical protein
MPMSQEEKVLSRKDWDDYLEKCLQIFAKYGYTPDPELASVAALANYVEYYKSIGLVVGDTPTHLPKPWYKERYSALFERWIDGSLCSVEKVKKNYLKPPQIRGEVPKEHMRLMMWECAMLLTEYDVGIYVYNEFLNALWGGIRDLLEAMGYRVIEYTAISFHPWGRHPEFQILKETCEKKGISR